MLSSHQAGTRILMIMQRWRTALFTSVAHCGWEQLAHRLYALAALSVELVDHLRARRTGRCCRSRSTQSHWEAS